MATLDINEANLVDAEEINWRLIVWPVVAVLILVVGGFAFYYYQQNQREQTELAARTALLAAKTPEDMIKVADQFSNTDGATMALLSAADASFGKHDFASAISDYQRIISTAGTNPELRDAAQAGLGSAYEAASKPDDAIKAYIAVGDRGAASSYAPYAYFSAARIDEQRGDKEGQRQMLTKAASLDPESAFVKQAQMKLKEMQPPMTFPASMPAPAK